MKTVLKRGLRGANAQVASQRQTHAGTDGNAVYGGDRRLVQVIERQRLASYPAQVVQMVVLRWRLVRAIAGGEISPGTEARGRRQ